MSSARDLIVAAAGDLLARSGRDAVTTRSVSAAAGVSEPTIYRLFGDKSGLLDAVAERGFADYVRSKSLARLGADPVDNLRSGWDQHVEFGMANPALYTLIYADPRPMPAIPAAAAAAEFLRNHIHAIAEAGRLTVSVERAVQLVHAVGSGVTFALIATPPEQRDQAVSTVAREALLAAITTDRAVATESGALPAAVAMRALLPTTSALTESESALMTDWLDRIVAVESR